MHLEFIFLPDTSQKLFPSKFNVKLSDQGSSHLSGYFCLRLVSPEYDATTLCESSAGSYLQRLSSQILYVSQVLQTT